MDNILIVVLSSLVILASAFVGVLIEASGSENAPRYCWALGVIAGLIAGVMGSTLQ